jgi:hypothetical protein
MKKPRSLSSTREHFVDNLRAFAPQTDSLIIDDHKGGNFHHSTVAIALYLSRFPQSAAHDKKFGFVYQHGDEILPFGVFQGMDKKLYGFIVPINGSAAKITELAKFAIKQFGLAGTYVRFLGASAFAELLNPMHGFVPAKEKPWHPDAPEEDESLSNSRIDIGHVIHAVEGGKGLRNIRQSRQRVIRLLQDTSSEITFVPITNEEQIGIAGEIVRMHLGAIDRRGKLVGSAPDDYEGILQPEIMALPSVRAYLGYLNALPVSVLIGEMTGSDTAGLYAAITLRDQEYVGKAIPGYDPDRHPTFSPLSTYMIYNYLEMMDSEGITTLDLGGSEHTELNKWKRHLGAATMPTYWAYLDSNSVGPDSTR